MLTLTDKDRAELTESIETIIREEIYMFVYGDGSYEVEDQDLAARRIVALVEQKFGPSQDSYVEYDTNNSGGSWWLSDDEWKALESAGWEVRWVEKFPEDYWGTNPDGRYMGALATTARLYGATVAEAIVSFEQATNQYANDEGCDCCGPPHSFSRYLHGERQWS